MTSVPRTLFICVFLILPQWKFDITIATGLIDDPGTNLKHVQLDSVYRIYQKKVIWSEAQAFCGKCYENFATFDNPEEITKIQELIYSISIMSHAYDLGKEKQEWGLERRYWFGLSDLKTEGSWLWTKTAGDAGTLLNTSCDYFQRWTSGQPDHFQTKRPEHCVGFWNPVYHLDEKKIGKGTRRELHTWNDMECDRKYYFICKKGNNTSFAPPEDCKSEENKAVTATLPAELPPPSKRALRGCVNDAPAAAAAATPKSSAPATTEKPGNATAETPKKEIELGEPFSEETMKKARALILDWHNIFRNWHNASGNVPRIELNDELNKKAQQSTDKLIKLDSVTPGLGESLYVGKAPAGSKERFDAVKSAHQAIKDWYYEICDEQTYPEREQVFNHFTQLVWMETGEVGVGITTDKDNTQIKVVAQYDPVGNYPGEYETNVMDLRCNKTRICNGRVPKDNKDESACPQEIAPPEGARRRRQDHGKEKYKMSIAETASISEDNLAESISAFKENHNSDSSKFSNTEAEGGDTFYKRFREENYFD